VAILLTYGTARVLLASDAEVREEEYIASGSYTGPETLVRVQIQLGEEMSVRLPSAAAYAPQVEKEHR
jgi:hypothetical protein